MERKLCAPRNIRVTKAIRVCVRVQISGADRWPHVADILRRAAAVLRIINRSSPQMEPQCFASRFPYGALHVIACWTDAKGLAMRAVAEVESLVAVAAGVLKSEGSHRYRHRFQRFERLIRR